MKNATEVVTDLYRKFPKVEFIDERDLGNDMVGLIFEYKAPEVDEQQLKELLDSYGNWYRIRESSVYYKGKSLLVKAEEDFMLPDDAMQVIMGDDFDYSGYDNEPEKDYLLGESIAKDESGTWAMLKKGELPDGTETMLFVHFPKVEGKGACIINGKEGVNDPTNTEPLYVEGGKVNIGGWEETLDWDYIVHLFLHQDGVKFEDEEEIDQEDDPTEGRFKYIASKSVPDSDGFYTDYTWYFDKEERKHVFVFGDNEVYYPEDEDYDWEVEGDDEQAQEEAQEWFDSYNGYDELDRYNESLNEDSWYAPLASRKPHRVFVPGDRVVITNMRGFSDRAKDAIGKTGTIRDSIFIGEQEELSVELDKNCVGSDGQTIVTVFPFNIDYLNESLKESSRDEVSELKDRLRKIQKELERGENPERLDIEKGKIMDRLSALGVDDGWYDESLKESLIDDIHNDFNDGRRTWKKMGFSISFDDAIREWNKKSKLAEPDTWFSKPIYDPDAWDDMVRMFSEDEKEVGADEEQKIDEVKELTKIVGDKKLAQDIYLYYDDCDPYRDTYADLEDVYDGATIDDVIYNIEEQVRSDEEDGSDEYQEQIKTGKALLKRLKELQGKNESLKENVSGSESDWAMDNGLKKTKLKTIDRDDPVYKSKEDKYFSLGSDDKYSGTFPEYCYDSEDPESLDKEFKHGMWTNKRKFDKASGKYVKEAFYPNHADFIVDVYAHDDNLDPTEKLGQIPVSVEELYKSFDKQYVDKLLSTTPAEEFDTDRWEGYGNATNLEFLIEKVARRKFHWQSPEYKEIVGDRGSCILSRPILLSKDLLPSHIELLRKTLGKKLLPPMGWRGRRNESFKEDYCDMFGCESGFFTRDDLNELMSEINERCPKGMQATAIYMGDDEKTLEVDMEDDEYGSETVYKKIDMRKIRKPSDLLRYANSIIDEFQRKVDGSKE